MTRPCLHRWTQHYAADRQHQFEECTVCGLKTHILPYGAWGLPKAEADAWREAHPWEER